MGRSFFAELQRRNVLRAGALYAASAWLLVQVATQVLPFFDTPSWVVRVIVVAAVFGFPIALLLAWFYQITPHGIARELDAAQAPGAAAGTPRLDRWIIAVLALALVVVVAERVVHRGAAAPASIAVLPFENLSSDKDNDYFAGGIQDEVLTRLAKIGSLHVISRTSTLQYSAHPGNLSDIARQLGVAHVLEGSVQRAGNGVRVNVQLIRAAGDEHVWAETYDRTLDDVFGVQSEIAQAIAGALQLRLDGREQTAVALAATTNPAAYDAFLRGRALAARDTTIAVMRKLVEHYAEAVRLDPSFALAWAHLSRARSFMHGNLMDLYPAQAADARAAAETAVRLQPQLGEAHLALGNYRLYCERDLDGARSAFEDARLRLPNDADVLASIAYIERRRGRWREAIGHLEQATRIDVRSVATLVSLGNSYAALRDGAHARAAFDRALDVDPGAPNILAMKAATYQSEGDLESARRLLAGLTLLATDERSFNVQLDQMLLERRYDDAVAALRTGLAQADASDPYVQMELHVNLGWVLRLFIEDAAAARTEFERALELAEVQRRNSPDDAGLGQVLALIHAGLGHESEAMDWLNRALTAYGDDGLRRIQLESIQAAILASFGRTDRALALVPRLLETPGGPTLADLRLRPEWELLRRDPRFEQTLAEFSSTPGKH